MRAERLQAFTDGVVAVIITIMVLEMHPPHEVTLQALLALWPTFMSYVLSFVYVGIYWNNHHHFAHLIHEVTGGILWANLGLLFFLSLIPFTTAWAGQHGFAPLPTALYGVSLLTSALAWYVLQLTIVCAQGKTSVMKQVLGADWKGKLSPVLYLAGIVLAFVAPVVSYLLYALVAALWIVPDRRIERFLKDAAHG
ncbi:MAG: DUF1211 domain-containing protein [Burkholderiales bacterium]|nr:DUF1211 domain-containing protein [Burkholderiales bacterium]